MAVDVFSVPVFLIVFRETLETTIIVAVLLAFLKQTLGGLDGDQKTYKALVRQVWFGTAAGLIVCFIIAGVVIGVYYRVGINTWQQSEMNYEGAFALIASVIITVVGAALLRVGKMQGKWRVKLARALEAPLLQTEAESSSTGARGALRGRFKRFGRKHALAILPFVTIIREGVEAIVFVAGVTFSASATSVPLPAVVGIIAGCSAGYLVYRGGSTTSLKLFLVLSSCLLYLVAAGLFSRAVWFFETQKWNEQVGGDAAEVGVGAGSYDIDNSVWHINCCSPYYQGGGGWGVFNAILGWNNSATYGSVISYNVYWVFVMSGFILMRFHETHGHWPLMRAKKHAGQPDTTVSGDTAAR